MKKKIGMIGMAGMATAMLLASACSQEELVQQPTDKDSGKVAMNFTAKVPNMTRAENNKTNPLPSDNFGVFAVKVKDTDKTTVMNNYKVEWKTTKSGSSWGPTPDNGSTGLADGTLTDNLSYWVYEGVDGQEIVYWDDTADEYLFYAYTTHKTGTDLQKALTAGTTEPDYLIAETNIVNPASHPDVPFAFRHVNGKVNMKFYTGVTGYNVTIQSINLATATGSTITTSSSVSPSADGIAVATTATGALNQDFVFPSENLHTSQEAAILSTTTYYCMPSSTETGKENGALKLTVEYTLQSPSETQYKTATLTINAGEATQWLQNTAYTYIFKIGGLTPIVFDGVNISDYNSKII